MKPSNPMTSIDKILRLRSQEENWPVYKIYGVNLASDSEFGDHFLPGTGSPALVFTCTHEAPLPAIWQEKPSVYASPYLNAAGQSFYALYREKDFLIGRYAGIADYYIWPDCIICHLQDAAMSYLANVHLLANIITFWLEGRGIPRLHASAVAIDEHAVAFLANSGHGKSTMAAAFTHNGFPFVTDDILPIEMRSDGFWALPGMPHLRLWSKEAEYIGGAVAHLRIVETGRNNKYSLQIGKDVGEIYQAPLPLGCIYVLERRDAMHWGTEVQIAPLSPRDAVIEMMRYSFGALTNEALGLSPQRLKFFAQLADQVPVRRLVYPAGMQHLERVRSAVLQDLTDRTA